jgi:hypothetical protein
VVDREVVVEPDDADVVVRAAVLDVALVVVVDRVVVVVVVAALKPEPPHATNADAPTPMSARFQFMDPPVIAFLCSSYKGNSSGSPSAKR